MRAILAIDPGDSTGVAWGIFNDRADTVKDALITAIDIGSATITGSEWSQAQILFDMWTQFKKKCVEKNCMDPKSVELVIEDFILRPGEHAGGRQGISPVRVGWMFEGYRLGRAAKWQRDKDVSATIWQPPGAIRHVRRLKGTPGWVKGREHERSAFAHIYERLNKVLR